MNTSTWIQLDELPVKSIFISDTHFGVLPTQDDVALQLLVSSVLAQATAQGFTLFLLGDIFDYWLEIGSETPDVALQFRACLAKLAKQTTVYMVSGNHDNWTNGYFTSMGITESTEGILVKKGAILAHGDGFKKAKYDLPRPIKHQILRNPLFISLFTFLFGKKGAWQKMQAFSKASSLKVKNPEKERQRLDEWAENVIAKQRLELVICGHDHQARLMSFGKSLYLNTGHFLKDHTFGVFEHGMVKLMKVDSITRNWTVVTQRSLS